MMNFYDIAFICVLSIFLAIIVWKFILKDVCAIISKLRSDQKKLKAAQETTKQMFSRIPKQTLEQYSGKELLFALHQLPKILISTNGVKYQTSTHKEFIEIMELFNEEIVHYGENGSTQKTVITQKAHAILVEESQKEAAQIKDNAEAAEKRHIQQKLDQDRNNKKAFFNTIKQVEK